MLKSIWNGSNSVMEGYFGLIAIFFGWLSNCWWVVDVVDLNWFRNRVVWRKMVEKNNRNFKLIHFYFMENMLQRLKLCFQLSVKYLVVKKLSSWVRLSQKFLKDVILFNTCCRM